MTLRNIISWVSSALDHDKRVKELHEANTREVNLRRAAEAELARLTAVHNALDPSKIVHIADATTALRSILAVTCDLSDKDGQASCRRIHSIARLSLARIDGINMPAHELKELMAEQ